MRRKIIMSKRDFIIKDSGREITWRVVFNEETKLYFHKIKQTNKIKKYYV